MAESDATVLSSKRGIPATAFIEDVGAFVESETSCEASVRRLSESHQKYKMIESNMLYEKLRLKAKLPDLQHSLDILLVLDAKREAGEAMDTRYVLSDQCYARATVPPTDAVCLWLGANVMLEYSLDEARDELQRNITSATERVDELTRELEFVKDQLTTTEVNMARVYNYGVQQRKQPPAAAAPSAVKSS